MAACIPVKSQLIQLLVKKIIIVRNTTAYTWDWYCHLVVDRASLDPPLRDSWLLSKILDLCATNNLLFTVNIFSFCVFTSEISVWVIFTTLNFICSVQMLQISQSFCHQEAFLVQHYVTLHLILAICKRSVVTMAHVSGSRDTCQ